MWAWRDIKGKWVKIGWQGTSSWKDEDLAQFICGIKCCQTWIGRERGIKSERKIPKVDENIWIVKPILQITDWILRTKAWESQWTWGYSGGDAAEVIDNSVIEIKSSKREGCGGGS